jgi:hypothetical protein
MTIVHQLSKALRHDVLGEQSNNEETYKEQK